jgi:hypothetical protein
MLLLFDTSKVQDIDAPPVDNPLCPLTFAMTLHHISETEVVHFGHGGHMLVTQG